MSYLNFVRTVLLIAATFCLCLSCQEGSKSANNETTTPGKEETGDPATPASKPMKEEAKIWIYSWVDKLNVREAPNTESKTIATVTSDEPLEYLGKQSEEREVIVLRGVAYDEPWLKVKTRDNTEGWVFGGAVRRKGEDKGNAVINDTQFSFPHFGDFDLSSWNKHNTNKNSAGDTETHTVTYQKGNQRLEITKTNVGEYGYSRTYKLMDAKEKLLKERVLKFVVEDDNRTLVETVKDYTTTPAQQYQREQRLRKHYVMLNAYPAMAQGAWKKSTLK